MAARAWIALGALALSGSVGCGSTRAFHVTLQLTPWLDRATTPQVAVLDDGTDAQRSALARELAGRLSARVPTRVASTFEPVENRATVRLVLERTRSVATERPSSAAYNQALDGRVTGAIPPPNWLITTVTYTALVRIERQGRPPLTRRFESFARDPDAQLVERLVREDIAAQIADALTSRTEALVLDVHDIEGGDLERAVDRALADPSTERCAAIEQSVAPSAAASTRARALFAAGQCHRAVAILSSAHGLIDVAALDRAEVLYRSAIEGRDDPRYREALEASLRLRARAQSESESASEAEPASETEPAAEPETETTIAAETVTTTVQLPYELARGTALPDPSSPQGLLLARWARAVRYDLATETDTYFRASRTELTLLGDTAIVELTGSNGDSPRGAGGTVWVVERDGRPGPALRVSSHLALAPSPTGEPDDDGTDAVQIGACDESADAPSDESASLLAGCEDLGPAVARALLTRAQAGSPTDEVRRFLTEHLRVADPVVSLDLVERAAGVPGTVAQRRRFVRFSATLDDAGLHAAGTVRLQRTCSPRVEYASFTLEVTPERIVLTRAAVSTETLSTRCL